jgi:hypothetical protein
MTGKHFVVGLFAVALFSTAALEQANAKILSYNCSYALRKYPDDFRLWIDTQQSIVVIQHLIHGKPAPSTERYPADIGPYSVSWQEPGVAIKIDWLFKNDTLWSTSTNGKSTFHSPSQWNCAKGSTPFPASMRASAGSNAGKKSRAATAPAISMAQNNQTAPRYAEPPRSNVRHPKTVEDELEAQGHDLPRGIYTLDNELNFNVLDSVYYDAANNQLSLVGHFDPRFQGPRIPYLEHLAVLLESPKPEFTLTWTPDSKKRVDAFLNRHLSKQEGESISEQWGRFFDRDHNLTRAGRYMLPLLGISPIQGNRAPGSLGVEVKEANVPGVLQVTRVKAGSPGEAAGLKVGGLIQFLQGEPQINPAEFYRIVRQSGAGSQVTISYVGVVNGTIAQRTVQATLTADANTDVWLHASRYDVIKALYLANGDWHAAHAVDVIGIWDRIVKSGQNKRFGNTLVQLLIDALGVRSTADADRQAVQRHAMTLASAEYDVMVKMGQAFDSTFHFAGNPVANAYINAVRRTRNVGDFSPATNEMDRLLVGKIGALMDPIFQRRQGIQIPPELVEDQFHVHPEMQPEYLGIPGNSQLARVMFAGDYLCKRLMNRPELKRTIPRYQTGFEFEQTHPGFRHTTGNYRLWISVDKMDTPQSPDGKILAFRNVKMRFNIREQSDSGKDLPNKPGSYEELLTSLWDNFELEYPTLHELRETAKLAAAAKWILSKNQSASLPVAGRTHWQGPHKVLGLVFIELTPDATRGMYKTHETIIAEGGVALTPFPQNNIHNLNANPFPQDSSVVDLTGLGSPGGKASLSPVLFSHQEQDSLASRIFHEKIVVPEPHPSAWVADFTNGRRTLNAVSLALNQLKQSSPTDTEASIEQRRKLEQVRLVAIHLAQVERALNLLDEKNSEQVREFQELQAEITEQRKRFYEHIFDFSLDNMFETIHELNDGSDIAEASEYAKETKENVDYLENIQDALKTGSAPEGLLKAGVSTVKRFSERLSDISRAMGSTTAAASFDTVTAAKKFGDVFAMEGEIGELEFITDYKVEKLSSAGESEANVRSKLLPLQKKLTDQLNVLCNDPQLKGLTSH